MQHIQDFLIEIAQGNFSPKLKISINDDEQIQTVKIGINMLAEELSSSVISRTFLNSIYNGINDMLIVIDEHGKIQKTNLVLETSLLFNEEELLNKPVEIIIHFNDVDTVRKHIQNALIFSNIQEVAINFVSKDKTIIPVLCSFSIIQDSSNKSTKVLLAAKNISALLSARDQLRDKNEELNLFIYKASHDLKSPVSSMLGLMQLVKKCSNMDEMKEYVHFMDRSII
jgi:PAS domain S-box-containing protein